MGLKTSTRLRDYAQLMRLDRPIGILLLLWPALWGLWFAAGGAPPPGILGVFVAGVVLMRSAGCVINDYADRDFDPHVERTRDRPIAAGRVSPREALMLFAVLLALSFLLVLQLNRLTLELALVGAALASIYPFMKRWTHLPQFVLGAAFGWSIIMAFAAVRGAVPGIAWVLFLANVFWSVAYDTAYARVDREDDLRVGVKSTAILFGAWDRAMILVAHGVALALLAAAGALDGRGIWYLAGLAGAGVLALRQQAWMTTGGRNGSFRAFLDNNRFGLAVFAGIVLDYGLTQ